MRKSSCWMVLVALLTIIVPTACADTLSIVFTGGSTTPVDTSIFAPTPGVLDLGTVTDMGLQFTFSGPLITTATPQTDSYLWFLTSGSNLFIVVDQNSGNATNGFASLRVLRSDSGTAIVSLNATPTPEPSSLLLLGTGLLGLVGAMRRKRLA